MKDKIVLFELLFITLNNVLLASYPDYQTKMLMERKNVTFSMLLKRVPQEFPQNTLKIMALPTRLDKHDIGS